MCRSTTSRSNGRAPEIELRQMFELEDFADVPPAVAEMEKSFKRRAGLERPVNHVTAGRGFALAE